MTTERDTAFRSAVSGAEPAEEAPRHTNALPRAREDSAVQTAPPTTTDSDVRGGGWQRLVGELRPPEPWTHRPASLAAMARYASRGGWTGPEGLARRLGVWWYRLIAVPVTLVCHYTAWLVARPSRALTAALVAVVVWMAVR